MPDRILTMGPSRSADQWIKLIERKGEIGTWGWKIGSDEVTWSHGMFRLLGFDPTAVKPSYGLYNDLLHPDDRRQSGDPFAMAASGALNETVSRVIRPDGSLRWLKNIGEVVYARDGAPAAMVGVTFDVTEWETALAEIRRLSVLSGLALNHIDAAPRARTPDGKLPNQAVLPGVEQIKAPVIDAWADEVHPDDRVLVLNTWREAVTSQGSFKAVYRLRDADGSQRKVISSGVPVRDSLGRIELWVGITVSGEISAPTPQYSAVDSPLIPAQIRAARAFLGWSARELAKQAGVSFSTIRRAENPSDRLVRSDALLEIQRAFEAAGISFQTGAAGRSITG